MAEIRIFKTSEKVLIWLHRENKTQVWLADQLGQTRQSISNKMSDNSFTAFDLIAMKRLGILID